ncbi:MAG: bifunctional DNA-formamidopyrimidine glycosylase/DNA-(apurinic or apyrimidinic site) lyase [Candidatus Saccharimonadales bacterium]
MPELPEVETVRRGLAELLLGQTVLAIDSQFPKSFPNAPQDVAKFVIGSQITAVRRRAKVLLIDLSSGYSLLVHLKMTGQLVYRPNQGRGFAGGHPNDSLIGPLPDNSTRVNLKSTKGNLYFNDQRRFGWMRLLPTAQATDLDFFKKIGPEPLAADFTAAKFKARLMRRPGTTVKAALLDQSVLAGVGNIYADEALFAAQIHPALRVRDVPITKLNKLFKELQAVLNLSLAKGGSSDRNYVDAQGRKGSYLQFAKVFRRQNQPCPRCGQAIVKLRVAGRGTHICPHDQKLPKDYK